MTLKLRTKTSGKGLRKHWYGRYIDASGKTVEVNLGVLWRGIPPEDLRKPGNGVFENSRARAQAKLDSLQREAQDRTNADYLLRKLYASKTGTEFEDPPLASLGQMWRETGEATERHFSNCDSMFRRFATWADSKGVKTCMAVTPELAALYEKSLSQLAPKTRQSHIKLLRNAYDSFLPAGVPNPFQKRRRRRNIVAESRSSEDLQSPATFHRKSLTEEELQALFDVARAKDPELYPAIVCGATTGLRKGDIFRLSWSNVQANTLVVRTSKTRKTVHIPIWPLLQEVLDQQRGRHPRYVFPELHELYEQSSDSLTKRLKKLAVLATVEDLPQPADPKTLVSAGLRHIDSSVPKNRRERVRECFLRYAGGQSLPSIAQDMELSKGTISNYLHEVEAGVGLFIRKRPEFGTAHAVRLTQQERPNGLRRASVLDWPALRTTFASLALNAGIPEATVRKITGHTTAAILERHYDQRNPQQIRKAMEHKLPNVLTSGTKIQDG